MLRRSFLTTLLSFVGLPMASGSPCPKQPPTPLLPSSDTLSRPIRGESFRNIWHDDWIVMDRKMYDHYVKALAGFTAAFEKELPGCLANSN